MNLTEFERVKKHAFHHYIGIKSILAHDGVAVIDLVVEEHVLNPSGTFHGGVLYTVSDIASFCALISSLEEGEIGVTNNINIQVMRAARVGDRLKFKANIIKLGKRLAFVECVVKDEKDRLIGKANVTKTLIKLS